MRRSFMLLAVSALALVAPRAPASDDAPLRVTGRSVRAVLDQGHVSLVFHWDLAGKGELAETVPWPDGAVGTGLRVLPRNGAPMLGTLMDRTAAAQAFEAEASGAQMATRVLLALEPEHEASVQIVGSDQTLAAVEVSALAPLEYEGGRYAFDTSRLAGGGPSLVTVSAGESGDTITVDQGLASTFTVNDSVRPMVWLSPSFVGPLHVTLGSAPLGDKHLARGTFAVPAELAPKPRGAHVALVLDRSRSAELHWGETRAAARAYLRNMQDAWVEIVTFHRRAETPFGRTLPVAQAIEALEREGPDAGNGSNLDQALALADALLSAAKVQERRVVVLSDFSLRRDLRVADLTARPWRSGALLHAARVSTGAAAAQRDDDAEWALLPRRTGGLFYRAQARAEDEDQAPGVFEEWARPKHVGRLTFKGFAPELFKAPTELAAGEGATFFGLSPSPVAEVSVQGEIWSKPFRMVARAAPASTQRARVLAFGGALLDSVPESQQRKLAEAARVVSSTTSFFFGGPGRRASEGGSFSGGGMSTVSSCGCRFGYPTPLSVEEIDRPRWLAQALSMAKDTCGASLRPLTAHVETTTIEIVDVSVRDLSPSPNAALARCVEDKLWEVMLPAGFHQARAEYDVP